MIYIFEFAEKDKLRFLKLLNYIKSLKEIGLFDEGYEIEYLLFIEDAVDDLIAYNTVERGELS